MVPKGPLGLRLPKRQKERRIVSSIDNICACDVFICLRIFISNAYFRDESSHSGSDVRIFNGICIFGSLFQCHFFVAPRQMLADCPF